MATVRAVGSRRRIKRPERKIPIPIVRIPARPVTEMERYGILIM